MSSYKAKVPDISAPLTELWSGFFHSLETQCDLMRESLEKSSDPRTVRKRWFEATSRALDASMRSPAFLRGMGTSLKTATAYKLMQEQILSGWAHHFGVPLASDLHELADQLRRIEETLRTNMATIEKRLANIEAEKGRAEAPAEKTPNEGQ